MLTPYILTNFSVHYKDVVLMPALGKSDHVCILWSPEVQVVKHQSTKRTTKDSGDPMWVQDEDCTSSMLKIPSKKMHFI